MRSRDASTEIAPLCTGYYGTVTAEYVQRKEFYYSWRVSGDSIHMQVSDYMEDSPEDVLSDLCTMICRRAKGLSWSESEPLVSYLRSDTFINRNRRTYIDRSRNLLGTDHGVHADLFDSVQRLLDSGLLLPGDVENSYMSWTVRDSRRRVGFCSTMFRVVGISSLLDSPEVPDPVRDYVVYHECLHLRQGYRPSHRHHDTSFRQWEHSYPGWREAEDILRGLRT